MLISVAQTLDVQRMVYHENGIIKQFMIPGWTDRETMQGPDVLRIFQTLKRKYSVEERNKWVNDLPAIIREIHQYNYVRESLFEQLDCPEDCDCHGNKHLLPDNMLSQPQRQRFFITTGDNLRRTFLDHIAKSKEGSSGSIQKEILNCKRVLKDNEMAEMKLHGMAGRKGSYSWSDFASSPPTLEHLHKLKSKLLTPFVLARTCTRSDKQIVKTVGKPKDVQAIIDRLNADPGNRHTKKEDSLLLQAYLCRSSTDLALAVPEELSETTEDQEEDAEVAAPVTMRSMFEDSNLLEETARCVVNLDVDAVVVAEEEKAMRDDLVRPCEKTPRSVQGPHS